MLHILLCYQPLYPEGIQYPVTPLLITERMSLTVSTSVRRLSRKFRILLLPVRHTMSCSRVSNNPEDGRRSPFHVSSKSNLSSELQPAVENVSKVPSYLSSFSLGIQCMCLRVSPPSIILSKRVYSHFLWHIRSVIIRS